MLDGRLIDVEKRDLRSLPRCNSRNRPPPPTAIADRAALKEANEIFRASATQSPAAAAAAQFPPLTIGGPFFPSYLSFVLGVNDFRRLQHQRSRHADADLVRVQDLFCIVHGDDDAMFAAVTMPLGTVHFSCPAESICIPGGDSCSL